MGFDQDLRIVRLEAFEKELWTTLQADLLFVIGTLLANKAREKTQAVLIESGFVEMLDELFRKLKWELPGASVNSARQTSLRRRNKRRVQHMLRRQRRRQRREAARRSGLMSGPADASGGIALALKEAGEGKATVDVADASGGGGGDGGGGGGGGGGGMGSPGAWWGP